MCVCGQSVRTVIDRHSAENGPPARASLSDARPHRPNPPIIHRCACSSIAGLVKVKQEIYQSVVMPLQNAHLMSGPTGSKLLEMPKGILLFGREWSGVVVQT